MNPNLFALAVAGTLLASCGEAANDAAPSSTDAEAGAATAANEAPAAAPATAATATAPAAQGETATYAPGDLLPGGAVDVLQREGFRPPA